MLKLLTQLSGQFPRQTGETFLALNAPAIRAAMLCSHRDASRLGTDSTIGRSGHAVVLFREENLLQFFPRVCYTCFGILKARCCTGDVSRHAATRNFKRSITFSNMSRKCQMNILSS